MKRKFPGFLIASLLIALSACGKKKSENPVSNQKPAKDIFADLPIPGERMDFSNLSRQEPGDPEEATVVQYQYGPVLATEYRTYGSPVNEDVVVRDEKDKKLVKGLFEAAFPGAMGITRVNPDGKTLRYHINVFAPGIYTVDEYAGSRDDKKIMRAELKDNFALIYRYINTDSDSPNNFPDPR